MNIVVIGGSGLIGSLSPDEEEAIIAVTTFDDWLKRSHVTRPSDRSAASASPPTAR